MSVFPDGGSFKMTPPPPTTTPAAIFQENEIVELWSRVTKGHAKELCLLWTLGRRERKLFASALVLPFAYYTVIKKGLVLFHFSHYVCVSFFDLYLHWPLSSSNPYQSLCVLKLKKIKQVKNYFCCLVYQRIVRGVICETLGFIVVCNIVCNDFTVHCKTIQNSVYTLQAIISCLSLYLQASFFALA